MERERSSTGKEGCVVDFLVILLVILFWCWIVSSEKEK